MSGPKLYTWKVEGTIPTEEHSPGRTWNKNLNIQVIAGTLEEAVEAAKERYPKITLHKCWRDRYIVDVIVVDTRVTGRGGEE